MLFVFDGITSKVIISMIENGPFSRKTIIFSLSSAGVVLHEQEYIITQRRSPIRLAFNSFTEFTPFSLFFPLLFIANHAVSQGQVGIHFTLGYKKTTQHHRYIGTALAIASTVRLGQTQTTPPKD